MRIIDNLVIKTSRALDLLAGCLLGITALLVVANILGRVIINRPVLGTFELVGFFTAAAVGLALARCAVENSHIAISYFTDKLPQKLQKAIEILVGLPAFVFLSFVAFNLFVYGKRMAESGVVASTTQLYFYPFIYLVAIGFSMLALIVIWKLVRTEAGGGCR